MASVHYDVHHVASKTQNMYIPHWRRAATPRFFGFRSFCHKQLAFHHDGGSPLAARRRAGLRPGGEITVQNQKILVCLLSFISKNNYLDLLLTLGIAPVPRFGGIL